jgi:hypothetical protein
MFYQYDFGDSWWHVVLVERVFTPGDPSAYPRLLDGRRACPPEDSGGPWFYDELLEIVDDPDHPDHEERIEWLGDRFDPEAFDAAAADRRLARFRTTPVRKPARTRPDIGPGAGDTGAQDRPDAADASGPPDHAGVTGNVAASHNFRAVLATLDRAAQRRPIDPAALDTARRLLEAHAAAEPGDLARLYKPAVWAAGALHAAFMLSDPDTAPSATQLAAGFGVSAPAVGSRSRTLRRHAPALELQREDDDADDSRPRRGLLRLL